MKYLPLTVALACTLGFTWVFAGDIFSQGIFVIVFTFLAFFAVGALYDSKESK